MSLLILLNTKSAPDPGPESVISEEAGRRYGDGTYGSGYYGSTPRTPGTV